MKKSKITYIFFSLGIVISIFIYLPDPHAKDKLGNISNWISLTYDANIYLSSKGGPLKNGCEGWATVLKTKEYIFASRCDIERLERLGLYANAATDFNKNDVKSRRITNTKEFIMIDYTDEKIQSLYGKASNHSKVHIILNKKKEYIYFRAEGTKEQLRELNFMIEKLIAANNSIEPNFQIKIVNSRINVAENKINGRQLLIGKNTKGETIALLIDKKGNYLGYTSKP